jgi:hypothetical protein
MRQINVLCPEDLQQLHDAYDPSPQVEHVDLVANWKNTVEKFMAKFHGTSLPRIFRVASDPVTHEPHVWTKKWQTDANWCDDLDGKGFQIWNKDGDWWLNGHLNVNYFWQNWKPIKRNAVTKEKSDGYLAALHEAIRREFITENQQTAVESLKDCIRKTFEDLEVDKLHWPNEGKLLQPNSLPAEGLPIPPTRRMMQPQPVKPKTITHLLHHQDGIDMEDLVEQYMLVIRPWKEDRRDESDTRQNTCNSSTSQTQDAADDMNEPFWLSKLLEMDNVTWKSNGDWDNITMRVAWYHPVLVGSEPVDPYECKYEVARHDPALLDDPNSTGMANAELYDTMHRNLTLKEYNRLPEYHSVIELRNVIHWFPKLTAFKKIPKDKANTTRKKVVRCYSLSAASEKGLDEEGVAAFFADMCKRKPLLPVLSKAPKAGKPIPRKKKLEKVSIEESSIMAAARWDSLGERTDSSETVNTGMEDEEKRVGSKQKKRKKKRRVEGANIARSKGFKKMKTSGSRSSTSDGGSSSDGKKRKSVNKGKNKEPVVENMARATTEESVSECTTDTDSSASVNDTELTGNMTSGSETNYDTSDDEAALERVISYLVKKGLMVNGGDESNSARGGIPRTLQLVRDTTDLQKAEIPAKRKLFK